MSVVSSLLPKRASPWLLRARVGQEPAQPLRFRKITPVWDEESVESGKVLEPLSPQAEMDSELQEPKSKPPEAAELELKLDPDVQARVDRRHSIWEVRRKRRVLRAWRLLWTASDKEDDLSETADPLMPSAEEFEAFVHGPTDWSDDSGEVKPEKPSPPASPASCMESHEPEETSPQRISTSTMELGQEKPSPSVSPCVSYQVPEEKPKPRVPPITSDKLDSVADAEEEAVNVVRTGTPGPQTGQGSKQLTQVLAPSQPLPGHKQRPPASCVLTTVCNPHSHTSSYRVTDLRVRRPPPKNRVKGRCFYTVSDVFSGGHPWSNLQPRLGLEPFDGCLTPAPQNGHVDPGGLLRFFPFLDPQGDRFNGHHQQIATFEGENSSHAVGR